MDIKTKRDGNFIMLQLDGNTLQGIWKRSFRGEVYYESDTFGRSYKTITEAKNHTRELAVDGYFGDSAKKCLTL